MKILYFVDGLNRGGVEIVVSQLARNFSKLDNRIYVICLYQDQRDLEKDFLDDINVFYLQFNTDSKYNMNYIRYLPNLIKLLRQIKPDIIHAHNSSFSYLFLAVAVFLSRIKAINIRSMHFSGFFLNRSNHAERLRYLIDKAASSILNANIISVGPAVEILVRKLYPSNKHFTIPNGIDTLGRFSKKDINRDELSLDENMPIVAYVARLCVGKNHTTLIKAWARIVKKIPALLVLLGDGPLREELQRQVSEIGIDKYVLFKGAVSNVEEFLSVSDIGVFPSESEGFSLVLLEMMSVGLPIIASRIPAFMNMIEENHNGVLFNTFDDIDLAEKICSLLSNRELATTLGRNARLFVQDYYSIEQMIAKHNEVYNELYINKIHHA